MDKIPTLAKPQNVIGNGCSTLQLKDKLKARVIFTLVSVMSVKRTLELYKQIQQRSTTQRSSVVTSKG